jgi:hypothetical protein
MQRHAARAFWHLAHAEGPLLEAMLAPETLSALLRLAGRQASRAAELAAQALRRLAADPAVRRMLPAHAATCAAAQPESWTA